MSLRPPQPPKSPRSLDAEERALAKSLPRLHGRTAPGPDLDASILATAQAAVRPAKPSQFPGRPRIRWIAPASLAASMVLAVGIAWQLRPLPALESAQPTTQSDTADMAAVQMIEPAPYDMPAPMPQSKPAQSEAAERQLANPPIIGTRESSPPPEAGRVQTPAPLPPPPVLPASTFPPASPSPPPPAPPATQPAAAITAEAPPRPGSSAKSSAAPSGNTLDTQAVDRTMRARTTAPAAVTDANSGAMPREAASASADKAGMIERTQQAAPRVAAPAQVMAEVRKEARMAADAGFVDDPEEDVPPATVNSPAVRDAWLHRIGELLEQGKLQEAKASLAEFRRRYPAAVLPPRLRALEIEP
ncbi:MAG: hypothetical protein ACOH1L_07520 [Thermomonas sp.]